MQINQIEIEWDNGIFSLANEGENWIIAAEKAGVTIPTGCLGGNCGACEIEVNGKVIRACINNIPFTKSGKIKVDFASDPYWQ